MEVCVPHLGKHGNTIRAGLFNLGPQAGHPAGLVLMARNTAHGSFVGTRGRVVCDVGGRAARQNDKAVV